MLCFKHCLPLADAYRDPGGPGTLQKPEETLVIDHRDPPTIWAGAVERLVASMDVQAAVLIKKEKTRFLILVLKDLAKTTAFLSQVIIQNFKIKISLFSLRTPVFSSIPKLYLGTPSPNRRNLPTLNPSYPIPHHHLPFHCL